MNKTGIEWTDYSWNPIHARRKNGGKTGNFCTRISPGCLNCYASKINQRWGNGLEYIVPNLPNVEFYLDEKELAAPVKLKTPSRIFVGDMFDLFHEAMPVAYIAEVLRGAMKTPRHTFQFLTKRAERMRVLVTNAQEHWGVNFGAHMHFGVSVEDELRASERIPELARTPVAVRWLSVEPMLTAIDLAQGNQPLIKEIDWIVCGGESGPGARPMHPDWARSLRDQCTDAGVPFFFKQWGEWMPHPELPDPSGDYHGGIFLLPNGRYGDQGDWWKRQAQAMDRVGKNKAGNILDGREWREFPAERTVSA